MKTHNALVAEYKEEIREIMTRSSFTMQEVQDVLERGLLAAAKGAAEASDLHEVLDLIDGAGIRATSITAPEDAVVKELCERVGYGAVMDAAARLWYLKDPLGAFTVGPCAATVRDVKKSLSAYFENHD